LNMLSGMSSCDIFSKCKFGQ